MNDRRPDDRDLATISADDRLLDLLAAGQTPDDGDEVTALLGAWRDDVAAEAPALRRAAPQRPPDQQRPPSRVRRARPRPLRLLVAAAAAVAALTGTASVMAGDARPGSPLWPLTRVLYGDWAESVAAEQQAQANIDDARQAIEDAQYADAATLLDEALALVEEVRDATVAQRLREQIDALRGLVPGLLPPLPTPAATTSAAPTGGASATPTDAPGGGLLPSLLPTDILPTDILPSGVLPSCVPDILPGVLPTICVQ